MARRWLTRTIIAESWAVSYLRVRFWACFPLVSSLASHPFYVILSYPSKVTSLTRLGGNLVWYGHFVYLSASFKWWHLRIPSDECHWYSRPVLPAFCRISWRTWERWWTIKYAKCNAVNLAPCMVFQHYVHAGYLAFWSALALAPNTLVDLSQHLSNRKSLELIRKLSIDGSPLLLVCCKYYYSHQSLKSLP